MTCTLGNMLLCMLLAQLPSYAPSWQVRDVNLGSPDIGANQDKQLQDIGLSLEVKESKTSEISFFNCTVRDTQGEERAVTLAFSVPVPAAGWNWWHDPNVSLPVTAIELFHNLTVSYYDAILMASRYPLAVMDNGTTALCLAVPPKPGRAVRFLYDPNQEEFRAEFDFGLSPVCRHFPSCADATVLVFSVPPEWAFRRGLERYYSLYSDLFERRMGLGGGLLRGAPLAGIPTPADFHFAWHDFCPHYVSVAQWAAIDEQLGVESYLYREPQSHWRYIRGAIESYIHVLFDELTPNPLVSQGEVLFTNGRAILPPGAALVVPGFPTELPVGLEAEFTLYRLSGLSTLKTYEIGWQGPFFCGLRQTITDNLPWVGAWERAEEATSSCSPVPQNVERITLKMKCEPHDNRTRVYAGYDGEVRQGNRPARLFPVGVFPQGRWTNTAGYTLALVNNSNLTVEVDDVLITKYAPNPPELTYVTLLSQLREDAERGDRCAQSTLVSGVFDKSGTYNLYLGNVTYTAARPFGVNPAPGVSSQGFPGWPSRAEFEMDRLSVYLGWLGAKSTMDGMYFDSMQGWGNVRNYRKEHWCTTRYPLTFDRTNNNAVCLLNIWGNVDWADVVSKKLHAHGQKLIGNDAYFQVWYFMPFVDSAGRELSNYEGGKWQATDDETYIYWRAMSVRRPFWTLMNDPFDETHDPDIALHMEHYFQRSLFYAVFPGMYHAHDGVSPWYWCTPAFYERDRALFTKYMPMIQRLDKAGWEPVPHAKVNPSSIRIERFGNTRAELLAFTMNNPTDKKQEIKLVLDNQPLGIGEIQGVREWIHNSPVSIAFFKGESTHLLLTLPANGYAVVEITAD